MLKKLDIKKIDILSHFHKIEVTHNKNFVITIGNYGILVALHKGQAIEEKLFFEDLNDENKKILTKLFSDNKSAPIYFLLDTIDQSYKKKSYPLIKKSDVIRLIKRDIANDPDKENLKNYIILNNGKFPAGTPVANKRWECLFVSSTASEIINSWTNFALEMPNRVVGIYMSPIETFSLFNSLKEKIKSGSTIKDKKGNLYCVLLHNKVSGIRQTVFSDEGIIFTRVVNYDFAEPDFLEKYEQDIHSTFEYLKRLFPDLQISELDIINIFSPAILAKLSQIGNIDFHLTNYSPSQAASEAGYPKLLEETDEFCDLLISKSFSANAKKILKFVTPKIKSLENLFFIIRSSYYLNLLLVILIGVSSLYLIHSQNSAAETKSIAEVERLIASQALAKIKDETLDGETLTEGNSFVDFDRILDIGKTNDMFGPTTINAAEVYSKLRFMRDYGVKLNNFSDSVSNFSYHLPSPNLVHTILIKGEISNSSGNIESLLTDFDKMSAQFKKTFEKNKVTYNELPRSIDFSKQYYSFPIEFTISGNQ